VQFFSVLFLFRFLGTVLFWVILKMSCGWAGGWVCAFLAGGVGGGGGSGGGLRTRHMHLFPKHVVRLGNLGSFFTLMCFFSSCGGYESRLTPLVHLEYRR